MLSDTEIASLVYYIEPKLHYEQLYARRFHATYVNSYYGRPGMILIAWEGSPTRCPVIFELLDPMQVDNMVINGKKVRRWGAKGERWHPFLLAMAGHICPEHVDWQWRNLSAEDIKKRIVIRRKHR
jgi:hypothetical protein